MGGWGHSWYIIRHPLGALMLSATVLSLLCVCNKIISDPSVFHLKEKPQDQEGASINVCL